MALQLTLYGIANMRSNVREIRSSLCILTDTLTVIGDPEIMGAALLAARDRDLIRSGINTVFDKLRDRFQGIAL